MGAADAFARPFKPGEFVQNPDGSRSTERTHTFEMPGGWANVPSLWMTPNGVVNEAGTMPDALLAALASLFEQKSGQTFARHRARQPAEAAAQRRSDMGGAGSGMSLFQPGPPR